MRLTLLIPELIWPEPGDQQTLGELATPGLAWLAGHARQTLAERRSFEAALLDLAGVNGSPCAALRLHGEAAAADATSGWWLCADPVHLRFHHERIVLADAGAFELDEAEATALVGDLNRQFAELGKFHVGTARRWYLRLPQAVEHAAVPLSAVAGRRIDGALDGRPSPLRRWLNEIQMVLHELPANARRQATGQPPVNSLWLWGGGELPAVRPPFSAICGDDPLARGLARAAGLPTPARPATLDALLAAPVGATPLVVLDQLLAPTLYEDGKTWREALTTLDRDWFVPLRGALGRRIETLNVVAPTVYGQLTWTLAAGERWKFWKKPRPLAGLARALAEGNAP